MLTRKLPQSRLSRARSRRSLNKAQHHRLLAAQAHLVSQTSTPRTLEAPLALLTARTPEARRTVEMHTVDVRTVEVRTVEVRTVAVRMVVPMALAVLRTKAPTQRMLNLRLNMVAAAWHSVPLAIPMARTEAPRCRWILRRRRSSK